ncbi:hypothetical protein [Vibrio sp. D431a]|uniref:hypothetical protein n=1 Tax=Vibrio sp. D431a TaxID=2837388 RepID=UPI002554C58D|nr:hypothetical protein [Vibrio sp. D431a]MDK9793770.1 hypothetical protein [Vibrio sp. D431a]
MSVLDALKVAFSYMPEEHEITEIAYGEAADKIKAELKLVTDTLIAQGCDPVKLREEQNATTEGGEPSPFMKELRKHLGKG